MRHLLQASSPVSRGHVGTLASVTLLALLVLPTTALAQSPWERAAGNLEKSFIGPLARSLALVAIVIGGLLFMFGDDRQICSARSFESCPTRLTRSRGRGAPDPRVRGWPRPPFPRRPDRSSGVACVDRAEAFSAACAGRLLTSIGEERSLKRFHAQPFLGCRQGVLLNRAQMRLWAVCLSVCFVTSCGGDDLLSSSTFRHDLRLGSARIDRVEVTSSSGGTTATITHPERVRSIVAFVNRYEDGWVDVWSGIAGPNVVTFYSGPQPLNSVGLGPAGINDGTYLRRLSEAELSTLLSLLEIPSSPGSRPKD